MATPLRRIGVPTTTNRHAPCASAEGYCQANNHGAAREETHAHRCAFGTMLAEIVFLGKICEPFANRRSCLFDAAASTEIPA